MSTICEDDSRWQSFFGQADTDPESCKIKIRLFEWYSDDTPPSQLTLMSTSELLTRDREHPCLLRIVAAPYVTAPYNPDKAGQAIRAAFRPVFEYYSFTALEVEERIHAVHSSFGSRALPGVETAWCSFLCKNVLPPPFDEQDMRTLDVMHELATDNSWKKSFYHLHVQKDEAGSTKYVTLLCFGAPVEMIERFRRLLSHSGWREAVQEPFLLFAVVFDELFRLVDRIAWNIAELYRPMEFSVLERARSSHQEAVDFAKLHNTAKYCIYLNEATEAALLTLDNISAHLEQKLQQASATSDQKLCSAALQALTYRKHIFQSTQLRLRSLSARMNNIISLSFNLVTQQDSRTLQDDSNAMKAIAILTLIFLPVTGIGSVFSTPFFDIDFDSSNPALKVARSFWVFWVIAVPLTILICGAWLAWYREVKRRRQGMEATRQRRATTVEVKA